MAPRVELNDILKVICPNIYFQPPSDVQMTYPAIVYERDTAESKYANNFPYKFDKKYQLTLITRNPDEDAIFKALVELPMCAHERFYVSDNLNHDVFVIYF